MKTRYIYDFLPALILTLAGLFLWGIHIGQAQDSLDEKPAFTSENPGPPLFFSKDVYSLNQEAQDFVISLSEEALAFYMDHTTPREKKIRDFRALIENRFDIDTISRFSLGRYWHTATPEQREDYQSLFRDYIVGIYTNRFDEFNSYDVIKLEVGQVRPLTDHEFVVKSIINFSDRTPIDVDWRVRKKKNRYQIIDVVIEDISMLVTQRSEFASVIQRGGGNVDVLLSHFRQSL